jgi:hypothetical protein
MLGQRSLVPGDILASSGQRRIVTFGLNRRNATLRLMRVWGHCWKSAVILSGLVQAQTNSISGNTVNAITGEPVNNVRILLMVSPPGSQDDYPHKRYRWFRYAASDATGQFSFSQVQDGYYSLRAEKQGFEWRGSEGPDTLIASGQTVTGAQVRLYPYGVIHGAVTDQNGEPVPYARIVLYSRSVFLGRYRLNRVRNLATDDEGNYRIFSLKPGEYFLRAEGRHGGTNFLSGDIDPAAARVAETFRPIYSDGSGDLQSAAPITVKHGSSIRVDFRVALDKAYSIRGVLSGDLDESGAVEFLLEKAGEVVSYHRASLVPLTGRFEMFDVPSGNFNVRVVSGGRSGTAPVVVGGSGQSSPVSVDLGSNQSAVQVPFSFQVLGESESVVSAHELPVSCSVIAHLANPILDALDEENPHSLALIIGNPGTTVPLYPGQYVFNASCSGAAFVRSVRRRSRSVGPMDVVDIVSGATPDPFEVVAEKSGSRLRIECPPCTEAVSFPRHEAVAFPQAPSGMIVSTSCSKGGCTLSLGPGEYTIYMFRQARTVAYRDPKVVATFQNGVRVRIEPRTEARVELREFAK